MYPIWSSMYHVYLGGPNLILIVTLLYSINLLYWTQIVLYCIVLYWTPQKNSDVQNERQKRRRNKGSQKCLYMIRGKETILCLFRFFLIQVCLFNHILLVTRFYSKRVPGLASTGLKFSGAAPRTPWEAYSAPKPPSCNHSLTLFARFYVLRTYICTETSTSNAPPMPHFYKSWLRHWNYCLLFLPRNLQ